MTCLRGASAVQRLLARNPSVPLRVLVVWEPVIFSDIAPPTNFALARITDSRAVQFWDHGLTLSRAIRGGASDDDGVIVWDYVAVFPAGARWEAAPPDPLFSGGTVVDVIDEVERVVAGKAPR